MCPRMRCLYQPLLTYSNAQLEEILHPGSKQKSTPVRVWIFVCCRFCLAPGPIDQGSYLREVFPVVVVKGGHPGCHLVKQVFVSNGFVGEGGYECHGHSFV